MQRFIIIFSLFILGCSQPIFIKIEDISLIGHTPQEVCILQDTHKIIPYKHNPHALLKISIDIHHSTCKTAQSRSLGSDFDGYIRIEISKNNHLVAKAQRDFKTEPSYSHIHDVWLELQKQLQWSNS